MDAENLIAQYRGKAEAIALEVMQDIYARLPWEQEFKLADGSTAKMVKFVSPKISTTENERKGSPCFAFDVIIEGGKLDHLEFYCYQTGGGGFV